MSVFYIRRGHSLPTLSDTLMELDGTPMVIPVTASITFRMRSATGGDLKVDAPATVVDANAGKVKYTFSETDTDTAGNYYLDWLFEDVSGVQAVPVNTYKVAVVIPDLEDV